MIADYRGKAVLVTGGTAGIGLATALAFAARGAETTLTYRFGSGLDHASFWTKSTNLRVSRSGGPWPKQASEGRRAANRRADARF